MEEPRLTACRKGLAIEATNVGRTVTERMAADDCVYSKSIGDPGPDEVGNA
jgi:hypothetical protein